MTPRERILIALNRRKPDRVPLEIKMTLGTFEKFKEKTGCTDFRSYFNMDFREVEFNEPHKINDFSGYFSNLPAEAIITEWGIARIPGSMPNYHRKISPLSKITSIKGIEEYTFPDFKADYRHQHLEKEVEGYHQSGLAAVAFMEMTIFERAWRIRGMENFMIDMISNQDIAKVLLDKITEISLFMVRRFAESDVDVIKLGDDIGTQEAMIMHPDMWRRWLKPRLAKVIRVAKRIKPEVLIYYHTDGFIEPVIPDLIEIGVDVLNPVQPECMDPVKLKKKYGSRLSFWGTIGTQTTMPFGMPDEVRGVVKHMIETVGRSGGLLIAPTHVLEPDVPWENILAFVDAVNDYGYY